MSIRAGEMSEVLLGEWSISLEGYNGVSLCEVIWDGVVGL